MSYTACIAYQINKLKHDYNATIKNQFSRCNKYSKKTIRNIVKTISLVYDTQLYGKMSRKSWLQWECHAQKKLHIIFVII